MSRFCALYSGSSGNSSYLKGGSTGLLIDAGVSCKAILAALQERQIASEEIQGILITHEHIDHIRGLKVLTKKLKVPIYSSGVVLDYLTQRDLIEKNTCLVPLEAETQIGELLIHTFSTPHDSLDSVGFRIQLPDGRTVGYATDLGHVTEEVDRQLTGCDLVMLEANYDTSMLENGRYPYYLKRRIKAPNGHLSNDDCAAQTVKLVRNGTTRLVLGHLSKENNYPGNAFQAVYSELSMAGMQSHKDFILDVAKRDCPSDIIVF